MSGVLSCVPKLELRNTDFLGDFIVITVVSIKIIIFSHNTCFQSYGISDISIEQKQNQITASNLIRKIEIFGKCV